MSTAKFTRTTIEGEDEHAGLDDGEVELADGAHDETAHPGHREDRLGDDGAAQEQPELEAGDRDEGQRRVDEGVAADDEPLGDALGPRGAHVVEVDHLQHARADDAEEERGREGGQGERGHDEGGPALPAGDGKDAELDREEQDEHDARPEHGHGGAEEDDERGRVVEDRVAAHRAEDADGHGEGQRKPHRERQ